LEQATKWEQSGEYAKAVDSYLKITPSNSIDKETALKCWLKAFDLSQKFLSEHKAQSVAQAVGPRLVQMNKATQAAEIYLKVDLVKECVDAFISAEEWGKAKKVAEQLDPNMVPYVEECYKQSLHKAGDIRAVADYDAVAALDIYANNGQWEECIKLAEKQVKQEIQFILRFAKCDA
jgi:intraflagellar transport protein 172